MSEHSKHWYGAFTAITIAGGLMLGGIPQAYAETSNPGVIPPYAKPYGMTYEEWNAKWWHWLYSLPTDQHPLFDTADCSEGQTGKVWFLGGTFTTHETDEGIRGEEDRDCSIPEGKALFFPIVNGECNEIIDKSNDEAFLRECANDMADHMQELQVVIDGEEVKHLGLYRVESPLFTIGPLPENNFLDETAGTTATSVADGYYIMLAPLASGEHDIHFEGAAVFIEDKDGYDFRFQLDIDYRITVEPPL